MDAHTIQLNAKPDHQCEWERDQRRVFFIHQELEDQVNHRRRRCLIIIIYHSQRRKDEEGNLGEQDRAIFNIILFFIKLVEFRDDGRRLERRDRK